ncbi:MAG: DNA polymerase III subunit delta [Gammaproteobacteria bacterium]
MKLTPEQLPKHLSERLSPLYFISGDEPLQATEAVDQIRSAARQSGFEEREVYVATLGFDWRALTGSIQNLSLFARRRLIEIRLPTGKPGREGSAVLAELADSPPPDTLLLVIAPHLDAAKASSRWAKALATAGVWIAVRPLPTHKIPAWLGRRLELAGLQYDEAALELLAGRVEGNLLAARQEIDKLVLLADGGRVTVDTVKESVADSARFDVFQLADAAMGLEAGRAIRILQGLQREGVAEALTLWALVREIQTLVALQCHVDQGRSVSAALAKVRVWKSRQGMVGECLRRHTAGSIEGLVTKACQVDRVVKGARFGQPWNALIELTLAIARPPAARAAVSGS